MTIRRLLCVVLLGLGFTAPASAQERCTAEPVASLPIIAMGGRVLAPVQVDGQPALFVISTGGFVSAVSETLAARLKLKTYPIRNYMIISDLGGERADKYAKLNSLVLGNQQVSSERYLVADFSAGVDGVIGADLLRNFDLDFDFPAGQLNLFRPRACADKPPGSGSFTQVDVDVTRLGAIRIPVTLDGKQFMAVLGTGGAGAITSTAARNNFGVRLTEARQEIRGPFGGVLEASEHTFHTLQIGEHIVQSPRLAVLDRQGFNLVPLSLGMAQLEEFRIFVSYRSRAFSISRKADVARAAVVSKPLAPRVPLSAALSPADAIARVSAGDSKEAVFAFVVQDAGVSAGSLYLNSESNYRDARNLAARLSGAAMVDLRQRLGVDPLLVLNGKSIRVTGTPRQEPVLDRNGKVVGTQVLIPITDAARLEVLP